MISSLEILKKYWGFSNFRPLQNEIITAVLNEKDVIALLPTGGGKSICFQVPALVNNGICLVISPLIALMKDQVENLTKKGIKATMLPSGTSQDELITLFDNIKFGGVKFLYISPERLQSFFIQQKIKELNINLVAIDEAHCISEWGHDFRPSYRNIKVLKELKPDVNFIALTATANQKVLADISKNLLLKDPITFKKSFFRENLAYQIFTVEDKLQRLLQIFTKTKKPAIVYVNSRKKTEQIANFLNANNFKSSFYHAGLSSIEKNISFNNWMTEKTPIIVATNAFGMGIDKPNVGLVIHLDLPSSIENYVQETGRAGRSGLKSFAVLLYNKSDILLFKDRLKKTLLTIKEIKEIHKKLYQHFRISIGEITEESYNFNILDFSKKYNFSVLKVDAAIKLFSNNGIIEIGNNYNKKSTLQFIVKSKTVLNYLDKNQIIKGFTNSILRTYAGLFEQEVKIDEFFIAKKTGLTAKLVIANLQHLQKEGIVNYNAIKSDAEITFLIPREDDYTINRFSKEMKQFIHQKKQKSEDLIQFINNNTVCRSKQILNYFDEIKTDNCGICDVCIANKQQNLKNTSSQIILLLKKEHALSSAEISAALTANEKDILIHLRQLLTDDKIKINHLNKYQLNL
ncbi:RecQ family ATP-dependent DNA helicase [Polaribacter sargassicola]|uniref:RecQ family ATP-dependent DNA helicase n=1 Tax=Polaribacter sargassicola TaxID=2836891 RepID=UPI001F4540AB|nr:ATP-dependent DNA helicase RecQ [Polaribacter sp. DS7-9]MCG1036431.1 ATP-dependent DNA helicase [Polaribacter sp. DS7-9]